MITRISHFTLLLRFFVYLLPISSFGLASLVRFRTLRLATVPHVIPAHYACFLALSVVIWVVVSDYFKLTAVANPFWEYFGARAALFATCTTLLLQNTILVFGKQLVVSRLFIALSSVILFLSVCAVRNFLRVASKSGFSLRRRGKVLIVGTDAYAADVATQLRAMLTFPFDIAACVRLPGQVVAIENAPTFSVELPVLDGLSFDEIVIAVSKERDWQLDAIVDQLKELGKPILAVFEQSETAAIHEEVFRLGKLRMVNLTVSPVESFTYTVGKASFDLLFSVIALIAVSPLLLAIAVLVKLTSRGPIFFEQERIGRSGQVFRLLKFRTMQCTTVAETDTAWSSKFETRLTPVGSLLRRFSLDELPQLFNVIRGDMSLVGPRPERPFFVEKFRANVERYNHRHCCRAGMTGWAQVNGLRGDTSIPDRVQHDLYYIRNWSFALDLRIIARTFFVLHEGS